MRSLHLACGLSALAATLLTAACASDAALQNRSDAAVCRSHFENDPVERDRCGLDPELRKGSVPDLRPQDLPIRSGQISD